MLLTRAPRRCAALLAAAASIAALLPLCGCPLLAATGATVKWKMESSQPREYAYAFSVTTLDGRSVSLDSYRGRPLVLNFWADWCPPCVEEFPAFQQVYTEQSGRFAMLSLAAPTSLDPQGFVTRNGYSWDFAVAGNDILELYGIRAIPDTLFIDSQGQVVERVVGGMTRERFEQGLARILP